MGKMSLKVEVEVLVDTEFEDIEDIKENIQLDVYSCDFTQVEILDYSIEDINFI